MHKVIYMLLLSFLIRNELQAQTLFTKQWTDSNNLIYFQEIYALPNRDQFLILGSDQEDRATIAMLDKDLNELWKQSINASFHSHPHALYLKGAVQNIDGSITVCGYNIKRSLKRAELLNIDPDGKINWLKMYQRSGDHAPGVQPEAIAQLSNGDYIMTGISGVGHESTRLLWLKSDSEGNLLQMKEVSSGKDYTGVRVFAQGMNSVIACYVGKNLDEDVYPRMLRFDENGNVIQWQGYGLNFAANMTDCFQINNGGYIITGSGLDSSYMMKLDSNFNQIWLMTFALPYNSSINSVIKMNDGSYELGGKYGTGGNNYEPFYMRTDPNGNVLYVREIIPDPSYSGFIGRCIAIDHPAFAGEITDLPFGAISKIFFFNTNENGDGACAFTNLPIINTKVKLSYQHPVVHPVSDIALPELKPEDYLFMSYGVMTDLCPPQKINATAESKNFPELIVYPNPATNQIFIQVPEGFIGNTISVLNVNGQVLFSQVLSSNPDLQINTSSFLPGIYMLRVSTNDGGMLTAKFLIDK